MSNQSRRVGPHKLGALDLRSSQLHFVSTHFGFLLYIYIQGSETPSLFQKYFVDRKKSIFSCSGLLGICGATGHSNSLLTKHVHTRVASQAANGGAPHGTYSTRCFVVTVFLVRGSYTRHCSPPMSLWPPWWANGPSLTWGLAWELIE